MEFETKLSAWILGAYITLVTLRLLWMAWESQKENRFLSRFWKYLLRALRYRWARLKVQTLFVLYGYVKQLSDWILQHWRTQDDKLFKQLLQDLQDDRPLK